MGHVSFFILQSYLEKLWTAKHLALIMDFSLAHRSKPDLNYWIFQYRKQNSKCYKKTCICQHNLSKYLPCIVLHTFTNKELLTGNDIICPPACQNIFLTIYISKIASVPELD